MRWFSHRRSPSPPGITQLYRLLLCPASCVRPSYGAPPTMHCQWGWLSSFLSLVTFGLWPWPSNSGEIFVQCRPTWPPSLIVLRLVVRKLSCGQTNEQTNKQTPLKTSTSLSHATAVGNQLIQCYLNNAINLHHLTSHSTPCCPTTSRWYYDHRFLICHSTLCIIEYC